MPKVTFVILTFDTERRPYFAADCPKMGTHPKPEPAVARQDASIARRRLTTDGDAPRLTVEFFGCYQCPLSAAIWRDLASLRMSGLAFSIDYYHFPELGIFPLGALAAEAAEAAGQEGKFWLMHDLLFRSQSYLTLETIRRVATETCLDLVGFDQDLAHHRYGAVWRADFAAGVQRFVFHAPALFLNGVRVRCVQALSRES